MGVTIRFQGGERAGEAVDFDDSVETIVIGRDPDKCQVVFPPGETKVGREHCALKRVLGRYRLQLNKDNPVLVDGKLAMDDQELSAAADLQLGRDGPKLVLEAVQRPDLLATETPGMRVRGRATMVRDAERAAKTGRRVGTLAVLLLLVAGGVAYFAFRKTEKELAGAKEEIAGTKEELARVKQREKRLIEALKKAGPSVYMVLRRNVDGHATGRGTAWVVGDGVLATNAHVAEGFDELEAGERLIVRSRGPRPTDFVVTKVRIHPGYNEFEKAWEEYDPVYVYGRRMEKVRSAGTACDIALLYVEDKKGLARPLTLASGEELAVLDAGEPVGFVGYSMENMAAISLKSPNPTTQIGHITAVTDYFGAKADDKEGRNTGHLIQHALPAAGGASGSPILNAEGRVVAILHAGNVPAVLTDKVPGVSMHGRMVRLASDSGVNFAQRADLIRELVEGREVEAQAQRAREWHRKIAEIFDSAPKLARKNLLSRLLEFWEVDLLTRAKGRFRFTRKEIARFAGALRAPSPKKRATLVKEATLPGPGPCVVVAVAKKDTAIDLAVLEKSGPNKGKSHAGEKFAARVPWLRRAAFEVPGETTIEATVSKGDAGTEIDVLVYQAEKREYTSADRRAELVALYREQLKQRTKRDYKAQAIHEDRRQLTIKKGPATDKVEVEVPAKGYYLAVAIPLGEEDIDLTVVEVAGKARNRLAFDTRADPFACVFFEANDKTKVELVVVSSGAPGETTFELHVFQMVPVGKK